MNFLSHHRQTIQYILDSQTSTFILGIVRDPAQDPAQVW